MDKQTIKNIVKLLGAIGSYLGLFFLIPIFVGFYYEEDVKLFLIFDILFFSANFIVFFALKSHEITLSLRDGILSVNLIWILVGFAGGVPLWLYSDISIMQAIFESISGFTTTGATIYKDIEALPNMILILRSIMHWLGGMGILVLGVGLLSLINPSGSLALFKAEASGIKLDKSTPKIKDTAIRLWGIYVLLTLVDAIFLRFGDMSWFDAINHAFSTISTGGFSTKNASFGAYNSMYLLWVTTIFMMLSGVNFLAHLKLFRGDVSGYKSEETMWYLIVFVLLSFFTTFDLYEEEHVPFFIAFTHASFNISSLITTTGFASIDYEQWGPVGISLAFLAMIASGNAGSTAGGVKIIRYIVSMKVIFAELKKILHPNAIIKIFINGSSISNSIVWTTFGFITLFVITNAFLIFYLFISGYDMMTSLSASIACVGNIGPGFGHVGPSQNYSFFTNLDLLVLSFGMILGRLEIYTFLLIFIPSFWKKF